MRQIALALSVVLSACALSHEREERGDGGAAFDGGSVEDGGDALDGATPDDLAPRCSVVPDPPCLMLASQARFPTGESNPGTLHAISAQAAGPTVLMMFKVADAPTLPPNPARWALRRFSAEGEPVDTAPTFLDDGFVSDDLEGGDLTVADGTLVAAWRAGRYDRTYTPWAAVGFDTFVRDVDVGSVRGPLQSTDDVEPADVVARGGLVAVGANEGVWVSRDDGTGIPFIIDTDRPVVRNLAAATLGEHRAVVVWQQDQSDGLELALTTDAAIVSDGAVEARARIFEPSEHAHDVRVVAVDDEVWIARFDTDRARFRESRIRVAHLDGSLARDGRDRWFSGWGGLTPAGLDLVVWGRVPWLLWRTIDARYGADTVLYARPLQEPECGYDVSDPVAVFRAETINERLLGATTDDALWITIPQIGGGATADLYQFQRCGE